MKKLFLLPVSVIILFGCADKKAQEKALLDSVITVHDKVMGADEQLLKNKTALDSVIKKEPAGLLKDSARLYLNKVMMADSAMDTWMHDFNPDLTNKPHADNMAYLERQKKLIAKIDSQMTAALSVSGKFINKTKTK